MVINFLQHWGGGGLLINLWMRDELQDFGYVKCGVITTYMYMKKEELMPTTFATNT